MGYSLHIELEDEKIELKEWLYAAKKVEGARLVDSDYLVENPNTGEKITIAFSEGDIEVKFVTKKLFGLKNEITWEPAFFFSEGRGTFNAVDGIGSPSNPVHRVASELASFLGASIVGDEGEKYNW